MVGSRDSDLRVKVEEGDLPWRKGCRNFNLCFPEKVVVYQTSQSAFVSLDPSSVGWRLQCPHRILVAPMMEGVLCHQARISGICWSMITPSAWAVVTPCPQDPQSCNYDGHRCRMPASKDIILQGIEGVRGYSPASANILL